MNNGVYVGSDRKLVRGALLLLQKEEPVFEDSLFASTARPSPRRGWAAAISFGLQATVLGVLVLIPMVFTDALPLSALKGTFILTAPTRTSAPPSAPEVHRTHPSPSDLDNGVAIAPIRIPTRIAMVHDEQPPSDGGEAGPYIPGAIPGGTDPRGNQITMLLNSGPRPEAPRNVAPANRGPVRISHMDEGLLVHRVTPAYPKIAMMAHQQGSVVLQATIGKDGTIQNLHVVSGPGLLITSAMEAVKQWRYRPYILNNEPVEVETQITVNFTLGG